VSYPHYHSQILKNNYMLSKPKLLYSIRGKIYKAFGQKMGNGYSECKKITQELRTPLYGTLITSIYISVPGPLDPPRANPESKSMVLEWNPPSKPNGVITLYSIYKNGSFLLNVTGNVTKYTVKNLQPFTPYTFAIAACTVIGCRQSKYSRPARTLESGKRKS